MTAWPTVTLGELTASTRPIQYGVLKPGPFDPNGVPLLRIQDMAGNVVTRQGLHYITPDLDREFSRSKLRGGEVLLSIQGTIGRAAIAPEDLAGANISRTIAVIDPDERLDPRFLRLFLLRLAAGNAYETAGSTRASLNIGTIRRIPVPVPPLEEQRRIVDIVEDHLSRLDAAGRSLEAAVQRSESLVASARVEAWDAASATGAHRTVGEVARVTTGSTPPTKLGAVFGDSMPFVTPGDVGHGGPIERTERALSELGVEHARVVAAGAVLVVCIGASIGKVGWVDRAVTSNQQINALTAPETYLPQYLTHLIASRRFQDQISANATSTTLPLLNKSAMLKLTLPVPPMSHQVQALDRLSAVAEGAGRLQTEIVSARRRAGALRRSLLAVAFLGRLKGAESDIERVEEMAGV